MCIDNNVLIICGWMLWGFKLRSRQGMVLCAAASQDLCIYSYMFSFYAQGHVYKGIRGGAGD